MTIDKERDERIALEIIVDCYDSDEQFTGWHSYLEEVLKFPFEGIWKTSAKGNGKNVSVVGVSGYDDCYAAKDMLVEIEFDGEIISEPLNEIFEIRSDDEKTIEAVGDWLYWTRYGNSFEDEYSDYYEDDESEEDDEDYGEDEDEKDFD